MPITLRSVKGSELTHEELDGNFLHLLSLLDGVVVDGGVIVAPEGGGAFVFSGESYTPSADFTFGA